MNRLTALEEVHLLIASLPGCFLFNQGTEESRPNRVTSNCLFSLQLQLAYFIVTGGKKNIQQNKSHSKLFSLTILGKSTICCLCSTCGDKECFISCRRKRLYRVL